MGKQALQAFVNAKREEAKAESRIEGREAKGEWLKNLDLLYGKIEEWLKEIESQDLIRIEYQEIELIEEYLGQYDTKKMVISIADESVFMEPIGAMVISAKGRVDMKGKNSVVKIVLVPEDLADPVMKINIAADKKKEDVSDKELVWKIATPPPIIQYIDLDMDSFSDALLQVMGG